MNKKMLKIKVLSEWKAIDRILDIDPKKLSENYRRKYFATKSLLIKESEFFSKSLNVPDYKSEMLTENVNLNTKDLVEMVDEKIAELCNKKDSVAKKIAEISVNNDSISKDEFRLETLMLGDVYDYLNESKIKELNDLGLIISKQMIESYIRILSEIKKQYKG